MSKLLQAAKCFKTNDLVQAERLYTEAIIAQPECGHAYLGLGVIALKVHQFDKAVTYLTKSCELLPENYSPLIHLSEAFNSVHSEIDGLNVLQFAARHFPNQATVHYYLGLQYTILGELEKAEQSLKKVIELTNDTIASFALLELTRLGIQTEQYLTLLKTRLEKVQISDQEKIVLHYALGNVLDRIQNFQQAWRHFENANVLQAKSCNFKTSELGHFFAAIKTTASQQVLASQRKLDQSNSLPDIVPIFILGLPRTGSTLLEQLLTEHHNISSAGEVLYLSHEVANYLSSITKLHYPYTMKNLTNAQLDAAAQIYLQKMSYHAKGKGVVIDKLPANFQSIGLIYKLFPNAKVIHIKRNLPDVALSIFRNYFAQNEPYFCSLMEFKQYHGLYADLMEYWHSQLPGFIFDVSYEDLVLNKTTVLNSILGFCGLSPSKDKVNKGEIKTVIKTLSNIQARRPMTTKSIKHWHNYAEFLKPFSQAE